MKHKISTIAVFALLLAGLSGCPPKQAPEAKAVEAEQVMKVVYHIDFYDTDRVGATLASINNMVNTYQETLKEYDVRIVFLGAGIRYTTADPLKGSPFAENKEFKKQKDVILQRIVSINEAQEVKLELCDITRTALNLDKNKLLPGVESVPSGVVRIAELQRQGFAYIKIQ
jgi:intracellular sulfur oxidation DsrE/DsrF family protein